MDKEILLQYQHTYRVLRQGGILLILVIVVFVLGPLAPAMAAEEKADEKSGWEFQAGPHMWFLSMDGSVTVKGQKSDEDISFSDIWDQLNIAGMAEFEGRKDRWGFFGDIIYANLGKDKNAQGIRIVPNVNVLWATAGGFYRLDTWDLADTAKNKPPAVTVDILAGARYTYLGVTPRTTCFARNGRRRPMEELIETMASKVDAKEIVGYLVSYCTQENTGDYEITTSARVTNDFPSPYRLYVPLLGKLFLTIAQGHPEPETLLQRIIVEAHKEFKESLKSDSKKKDEFTAVGKF